MPPPFDTGHNVRLTGSGLIKGTKGAQQVASLRGIDVQNFSQKENFGGGGGGADVSLDHRVEALFLLIMSLAQYVVHGTKVSG